MRPDRITRRLLPGCAAGLLGFLLAVASSAAEPRKPLPLVSGETLHYVLKWTALPVGEATVTVQKTRLQGRDLWHFSVSARTNQLVDPLYKVRDHVDAYADLDLKRSYSFHQKQREGSYRRDLDVQIDQVRHQATRRRSGKDPKVIQVYRDTYDPLTAFFALRQKRLGPHMSLSAPISDGKKCVIGVVHVIARQRISIEAGTFDALLVKPDLEHVGGIIRKTKDAEIKVWLTDDARHIPLKVESKVVVGHFSAELIALPPLPLEPPTPGQRSGSSRSPPLPVSDSGCFNPAAEAHRQA